jgi:hypothetical protein
MPLILAVQEAEAEGSHVVEGLPWAKPEPLSEK